MSYSAHTATCFPRALDDNAQNDFYVVPHARCSPSLPSSRSQTNSQRGTFTSTPTSVVDTEIISLDDDAHTLEAALLPTICELEISALNTWDAV